MGCYSYSDPGNQDGVIQIKFFKEIYQNSPVWLLHTGESY